jgi:hypothetical protein
MKLSNINNSQSNPFNINELTEDEISNIRYNTYILFTCKECKKDIIMRMRTDRMSRMLTLLCNDCYKKQSIINNYGSEDNYIKNWQSKMRETCKDKYGTTNPISLEEFKEKRKNTCLEVYGTEFACQNKDVVNKIQSSYTEEKRKNASKKAKKTNIEKYGGPAPMCNLDIQNKAKKTSLLKYGVEHPSQLESIKEKAKQTNLSKFGLPYHQNNWGYKYIYNDQKFDSSWELIVYLYLIDQNITFEYHPKSAFTYIDDFGKTRYYEPDFIINGVFTEIKGDQFFDENGNLYNPYRKFSEIKKQEKMKELGVNILREADINEYKKILDNKNYPGFINEIIQKSLVKRC